MAAPAPPPALGDDYAATAKAMVADLTTRRYVRIVGKPIMGSATHTKCALRYPGRIITWDAE